MYFIHDIDKQVFDFLPFRYYSLMFLIGFIVGFYILRKLLKEEGNVFYKEIPESFLQYAIIGTIVGARLGHVLFYDWEYYSKNLVEILFVWQGGLASHGGVIGVFIATLLFFYKYRKKYNLHFFKFIDKLIIVSLLTASLIRIGNFINSEIIGTQTSGYGVLYVNNFTEVIRKNGGTVHYSLGQNGNEVTVNASVSNSSIDFSFYRDENIYHIEKKNGLYIVKIKPRFPAQLVESGFYFLLFLFSVIFYRKIRIYDGLNFALYLSLIFVFRFFIEFFKENQVASENGYFFNLGQILSLPIILFCIVIILVKQKTWRQLKNK